jgi:exodeoxyribonuclease V gamma subunit
MSHQNIKIYQSNDYALLCQQLSEIYNDGSADVFRKEYIFYQAKGIAERLPSDLALISGFFGGAEFIPAFKLQTTVAEVLGEENLGTPNTTELCWKIFKALGSDKFKNFASDTAKYYENDELRRMQLAEKLSVSFTAYIEFQPDLLKNWEDGKIAQENPHENWQAFLWKLLLEDYEINPGTALRSAAASVLQEKVPRIFLYGISMLSEQLMETLKFMEKSGIKVYLFLFNPLFGENNNSIHAEYFGKIAADNDYLLNSLFPGLVPETLFSESDSKTNLYNLKNSLVSGDDKNALLPVLEDDSLSINSCYTPVRELEALYHHLLYLNSKDRTNPLLPKNILVLLPDLELYSPYISSVFESGDYLFSFPYSIEKQHYVSSDSAATVLDTLLDFEERNFTSEQVLKLLENKSLSDALGISDTERLYEMLQEANICRDFKGIGALENETYLVSFDYGLSRIAYGFALGENIAYKSDGISFKAPKGQEVFPVDIIEGSYELNLFSKLRYLTDSLNEMLEYRKNEKTLEEWTIYLKDYIVDAFIYPNRENEEEKENEGIEDSDEESAKRYFDQVLEDFLNVISTEQDQEKISYKVFRMLFKSYFSNLSLKRGSYRGGITFAGYQSMQGLDYKFVAVLGLNYDSLPRNNKKPYFHIENKSAKGIPNLKEQDKYTFLQSILGAKEHLYLSYIGRSSKDNSKKPASVLLDMVLDCFEHNSEAPLPESRFRVQHPLHSFSSSYNRTEYPMLKQYSIRYEDKNNIARLKEKEEKSIPETLTLDRLIAFVKNPFKHYFNQALGIYLSEDDDSLKEIELLSEPDHLTNHNLKTAYMESELESLKYKHLGMLPLANAGKEKIKALKEELTAIKSRYEELKADSLKENLSIELPLNSILLKGTIGIYANKQIFYCTSKEDSAPKYIVESWIRHLFAVASGIAVETYLLKKGDEDIQFKSECITADEANTILAKLTEYYIEGLFRIQAYTPEYEFLNQIKYPEIYQILAFDNEMSDIGQMQNNLAKFSPLLKEKIDKLQTKISHHE